MWCNKVQFPNTNPQCGATNSPQSLSGNGCLTTKDPLQQLQNEGGMEVGSIYNMEGVDVGCDPSPPNPWTTRARGV